MGALLLTAALTTAQVAAAQSADDKAAAEALFDQGRAAMQQRDFTTACGLLERSQHMDPAVGTLLYLAECYEKSGRTASAWATFREAADAADAARSSARAQTARQRAARIEPQLSRLTITIDASNLELAGFVVQRREQTVRSALFNVPVPVDPGNHVITAEAPGHERWTETVTVPERAGKATVNVPALRPVAPATAAPVVNAATSPSPRATVGHVPLVARDSAGLSETSSGATQRTLAYVAGGVGIAGLAVGSYFGLRAFSKNGDADTYCPRGYLCDDPAGVVASDDARAAARASNVAFAIGAAALVGGVVLYATAPARAAQSTSWRARLGARGVVVEGSFQ